MSTKQREGASTTSAAMKAALDLQLFADAGTLVNATGNYVNAYTGDTTAFDSGNTMSPTMKTYYDTELLENARPEMVYTQLGRKQPLPANHGTTVEWRKFNTLPNLEKLTEGVIPTGKKLGMTSLTVEISQYGEYFTVSDRLDIHAIDNVILGGTQELGAASGKTWDELTRDELMTNTNVLLADAYDDTGYKSTPASRAELKTASVTNKLRCRLTPDMIAKAVRQLRNTNTPYFEGKKYVAVVHPSAAYDLMRHPEWNDYHKYSATTEIFEGELGELYGVRFLSSTLAPVWKMAASDSVVFYTTMVFGKDAFGTVDPEGAGMEMIIKDRKQAGGPLEQFSTVGAKGEIAVKILYPERMVCVEHDTSNSAVDEVNCSVGTT